jgi:hypothetical protein
MSDPLPTEGSHYTGGNFSGQDAPNLANSLLIYSTQHDIQCNNDHQMSLDYHLVDPLGDDEKDEQQSDVLDGC